MCEIEVDIARGLDSVLATKDVQRAADETN